MNKMNSSQTELLCKELSSAFQGLLSWKWDERFETALAEFKVENKARVHDELVRRLGNIWDVSNVETAPEAVQTIINAFGGMMPGQLLFTSDPEQEALVFCAWWPWGNGITISLRIAPFYQKPASPDADEAAEQLKEWFGIKTNP